jgi:UDP-N-acetylglucosamine/UDP-N-acetylgalactosamine 4-epimerase
VINKKNKWLVTGAAGFIGSHLVEQLLLQGEKVIGFDNFSTGKQSNLEKVRLQVGGDTWENFNLIKGDLLDLNALKLAAHGIDVILHQAALGSVPLSLEQPLQTHSSNVTGFINVLEAARSAGIKRVVYASSSAVYGNSSDLPLKETSAGDVLSPYSASKLINEVYARSYAASYGMVLIGLRYFNVFGPRQDPNGAYAAVIPKWIQSLTNGDQVVINGDGSNTRDFCFVGDVVKANILAAETDFPLGTALALNVGSGRPISLIQLHEVLNEIAQKQGIGQGGKAPHFGPGRPGDIVHSNADVTAAWHTIKFTTLSDFPKTLEKTFLELA